MLDWKQFKGEIVSTDMDGVLCKDGEPFTPLYLPPYPIEDIITGRHERHRKVTESWLKAHDVKYKNLYMMDVESFEWKAIAEFKIRVLTCSKAEIFVESEKKQAEYIKLSWSCTHGKVRIV